MKVPKVLTALVGVLICISLIRAVNNAGPLSVTDIVAQIQNFQFNFSRVNHLFEDFRSGAFKDGFISWNSSLTGVEGFFENIRIVVSSFFSTIISVIKGVVHALWNVLVEAFRVLLNILHIVVYVCGFTGLTA